MPRDFATSPDNGQMYAFQAISALGQPQDSIIEPTRGFTNPSLIAFDQFGLAPLFAMGDAKVAVVAKDQRWTIGSPSANPVLDIRQSKEVVDTGAGPQLQDVIDVYS